MFTRTKIICTIGPSVSSYDKIVELIDAGMNVARLNFSHGTHSEHLDVIEKLKRARKEKRVSLSIMLDTKGPEMRVKKIQNGSVELKAGQKLKLSKTNQEGNSEELSMTPEEVIDDLEIGMHLLFDDGYISAKVVDRQSNAVILQIENAGVLKSQKGINIPHSHIKLPFVTPGDIEDLMFGAEQDIDYVAASFIRSAENVLEIKKILRRHTKKEIPIISKIESVLGVKNFDEILQASDGIMVARGDLGVELPLTQVPKLQKMMIRKCLLMGKPVVTATQMLESMIHCPRPTRAEVSDVANAIYDSTGCVMLSGETAIGQYAIETVKMMHSVVEEAEKDFDYRGFFSSNNTRGSKDTASAVAIASVKTAYSSDAKVIFVYTNSGFTAQLISRLRPEIPIIALTNSLTTYNRLAFLWGVIPVYHEYATIEKAFEVASCFALTQGIVHYGDLVIVTAGTPFGMSGTTNMMLIQSIGDVIARGIPSQGEVIFGEAVVIVSSSQMKIEKTKDRIAILSQCEEEYAEWLEGVRGLVIQSHGEDNVSEVAAISIGKKLAIPVVVRADHVCSLVKDGETITLNPAKGIVFRGRVVDETEMISKICCTDR